MAAGKEGVMATEGEGRVDGGSGQGRVGGDHEANLRNGLARRRVRAERLDGLAAGHVPVPIRANLGQRPKLVLLD